MDEKFCNGCQQSKTIDMFWLKHAKAQARCKECQKEYHKQHYKDNVNIYKNRAKVRNDIIGNKIRAFLRDKKNQPCQDCKISYPYYVMDFDHRPTEIKEFNLSKAVQTRPDMEKIIKEINKCDIVCSNCHRIRTYNRTISRNTQVV